MINVLHILLVILKLIGIILAVMLGILLLLVGVILFVPVRYSMDVECDHSPETLRGVVKVRWLLNLLQVNLMYGDKEMKTDIRIAWKRIGRKEKKQGEESVEKESVEEKPVEKMGKVEKERPSQSESVKEENSEQSSISEGTEEKCREDITPHKEKATEKTSRKTEVIRDRIVRNVKKLKCTFQAFCDKIKTLSEKKDVLSEFIKSEVHLTAFSKVKTELFKLLKRLKPKKINADIQYGFDDPCMTGQVLAGLGMLYPLLGENVQITPDFEHRILKGSLQTKGKIYVVYLVALVWNLFWCKEIRRTYKDIRNFKL